ncbi:MAG: hypothetical protein HQL57_05185 [Magnetococcales bacterium]|nr:hypothetical protein [Magnetococcales bacterium]MBF0156558.1 hypothetical protein [Magnetococcales bacterium]
MKARILAVVGGLLPGMPVLAEAAEAGAIQDPAAGWDHLWNEVLIDLTVMGGVFAALAVWWLIKYKATSPTQIGRGPKLSRAQTWSWALVPAFVFMADDFFLAAKGWTLWNIYRTVPENAMEVKVTGMMWNWQFEYENGVTTQFYPLEEGEAKGDGLVVPVGRPVVLRMTSLDVVHSFGLTDYRVKEDLMPGRITYIWFYPKEVKESVVTCTEYCGMKHSYMYAPVKAVSATDFDSWMNKKKQGGA